eukprot:209009-Chlamydomonas_euryale.AAC.1
MPACARRRGSMQRKGEEPCAASRARQATRMARRRKPAQLRQPCMLAPMRQKRRPNLERGGVGRKGPPSSPDGW